MPLKVRDESNAPLNRRSFGLLVGAAGLAASATAFRAGAQQPTPGAHAVEFRVWNPLLFGARGDGRTKDTAAVQATIDRCAADGGGIVVLPQGKTFLCSTLVLRSHVELHLMGGSTLLASPDREEYHTYGSLLFAHGETNVRVSGTGTIDGNFAAFFPPKGPDGYPVPQPFLGPYDPLYPASNRNPADGRPRMILLVGCRNTVLEEFTIRNSPTWTIHPVGCDDLRISGLSILNDLDVPNCDGIDIDHCRQVRIDGCNIVAGDDCLILKASRNFGEYGPCEGITITNCTLESSSAGIKIETEGPFPLRSAVISNCTIVRSNRGISFLNRDGATVEDLIFSNMTISTKRRSNMWWGSGEPVALSSVPRAKGGAPGTVRGVSFSDMQCRGESGFYLRGDHSAPLQQISVRNIDLTIERTTDYPGGYYDMRPGDLFGDSGLDRRPTAGIFAADVQGLSFSGVSIHWAGEYREHFGAALDLQNCTDVSLVQVAGAASMPGSKDIVLDAVAAASLLHL